MVMKGHFTYNNFTSMQNPSFMEVFTTFFEKERPKRLLEIGTAQGGTASFFRDKLNELGLNESPILTFEVNTVKAHERLEKIEGITLSHENIFDQSYRNLEKPELISDFIKGEGTTIVCCDGGSKINELNTISSLLKPGDFILAHDYSPNKEYHEEFMKGKIWDWIEIADKHINTEALKLQQYDFDLFIKAAWCCFKKVE